MYLTSRQSRPVSASEFLCSKPDRRPPGRCCAANSVWKFVAWAPSPADPVQPVLSSRASPPELSEGGRVEGPCAELPGASSAARANAGSFDSGADWCAAPSLKMTLFGKTIPFTHKGDAWQLLLELIVSSSASASELTFFQMSC